MSSTEQDKKSNLKICRICQEDELESESKLLKPCKCNSHIHKECLLTWIKTKINSDIIDYKNDLNCEICLTKIKYTHSINEDSAKKDENGSQGGTFTTISNMSKILFKRNENGLKNTVTIIATILIPIISILWPLLFIYRVWSTNNSILESEENIVDLPLENVGSVKSLLSAAVIRFLNPKYFPKQLKDLTANITLQFLSHVLALFPLIEDVRNGFNTSTLHRMYEYEFGVEKAISEYDKIQLRILAAEQSSLLTKIFQYCRTLIFVVPIAIVHILLQEGLLRYLYVNVFGEYSESYSHYFGIYYNFVALAAIYFCFDYQKNRKSNSSYVKYHIKNSIKLVLNQYWQCILIHLLELISIRYLKVDRLIRCSLPFEYHVYQPNLVATFKVIYVVLASLRFLRTNIFRFGVLYKFPSGSSEGNSLKNMQIVLIEPVLKNLKDCVVDIFAIALTLLSIGGFALIILYNIRPQYFPLVFTLTGLKSLLLESVVSSLLLSQISVLKDVVYLPLFHKLSAFLRLSNYLFDYDRPLEKGIFVYRNNVNKKNPVDLIKARNTNDELYEKPCFSNREALYFLEKGDSTIDAYLLQDGFNIKAPDASSVLFVQKGFMQAVDSSGATIVKEEEKSEEDLLSETNDFADGAKTTIGMFNHAYNDTDSYDVCFVPNKFKIRLISFFTAIAAFQNLLVIVLFLLGHRIGSFLFAIPKVKFFYETALQIFSVKQVTQEIPEFFNANDQLVLPKVLSGVSILIALMAVLTNNNAAIRLTLFSIKRSTIEAIQHLLIMLISVIHIFIFNFLVSISLTYFYNITTILYSQCIYGHAYSIEKVRFLIYQISMFFDEYTFYYWLILGFITTFYNFFGLSLLFQKIQNVRSYTIKNLVKDLFNDFFLKQYMLWFRYFVVPFALQHIVLLISALADYFIPNSQSLFRDESLDMRFIDKAYYTNLNMVLSGSHVPIAIVYKALFSGYIIFYFVKHLVNYLKVKWNNLKTLTIDNTVSEDDVIILEDDS